MITSASPAPTEARSSPASDPDLSALSARSPMLRARPRLPAGPRTRKQTTFTERQLPLNDSTMDQQHAPLPPSTLASPRISPGLDQHLSNSIPSSSAPLSSFPFPPQLALNPQTETDPPVPPAGQEESTSSHPQESRTPDIIDSHESQATSFPSPISPPSEPHPGLAQPTPITEPSSSRPTTPTPLLCFSSPVTGPAFRQPSQATIALAMAPPLTLPAAQIDLTPEPLPYMHLTLDAAHWTLTSTELQHLVSSAIRQSAKEQFIRLLPPSIIDTRMPEDAADIDRCWDTAAAHWRFEAHRRNMLLRALSASGADSDLLSQLSGTLSNLDLHVQSLLHAAAHRMQLAAARDTHRASALAVALRKLNASYARRTRDLDKARTHIAVLHNEVDEAWKVAEEQAAEVDRLKAAVAAAATDLPHEFLTNAGLREPLSDDEDDASSNAPHDGASVNHTVISRAEVVDVTGKAIAAQARLTTMHSNNHWDSFPQPSPHSTRSPSSPVTSGSDILQKRSSITSQVSRVSAARKRSKRKSKASLRLPRMRSRSAVRGESGTRSARSKSRSKKGKEPAQAEPPVPWFPADLDGSFLEMEGRPAGDEAGDGQVGSDGEAYDDIDGSIGEELLADSTKTAEPTPQSPLSIPTTVQETQALSAPKADTPHPSMSPPENGMSQAAIPPSASAIAPEQASQRRDSSISLPSTSSPSAASTLGFPPSLESHQQAQPLPPPEQSSGTDSGGQIAPSVDMTSVPTSIFTAIASSASTATTAASAPDLPRRVQSLNLPSPSSSGDGKQYNGGSKIRRSISELLHLGSGSRVRLRSVPLPFKGRGWATGSNAPTSTIRHQLREEVPPTGDGTETEWETVHNDEA